MCVRCITLDVTVPRVIFHALMHLTQRCRAQCVRTYNVDAATRLTASSKDHFETSSQHSTQQKMVPMHGDPKLDFLLNCTDLGMAGLAHEDIVGLDVEVHDLGILWQEN